MRQAAPIHLYRPQRTKPENLEAIFVAREPVVNQFLERLSRIGASSSRQHYLLIGPRGIGKTCLLEIIQHRVKTGPLTGSWVPVAVAEEGYRFRSVAELLLDALHILAETATDKALDEAYARLRYDTDDQRVVDLALDAFRGFHRRHGKRIIFMVENVNRILDRRMGRNKRQIALLRKILIEEDWLVMLATSPTFVSAVSEPEAPLFAFFQIIHLQELTRQEQETMLRKLAALENNEAFEDYLRRFRPRLQALYHFTGGNPRLAIMLYDLIAHQRIFDVQAELDALLDQLTPFYQDRMSELADQEALLLERMALLPEGCTPTELAREARMEATTVRALIVRLENAGYVRREQRRKKQTVYIIPERLFRIWHQRSHFRADHGRTHYLLEFFSTWYSTREEHDQVWEELVNEHRRGAAVTALRCIALDGPVPRLIEVLGTLLREASDDGNRAEFARYLLRSAFRSGNPALIRDAVEIAVNALGDGEAIFAPHLTALAYIESDRDPAILERQQPEMREAAMLLAGLFDESQSESQPVQPLS